MVGWSGIIFHEGCICVEVRRRKTLDVEFSMQKESDVGFPKARLVWRKGEIDSESWVGIEIGKLERV